MDGRVDHKEGWALKKWCFPVVVLEKTLESPLDCKEIQPVHPKGEAETPILWPPNAKSWHIWIDPDAGKDWGQEEKGMTEDKRVGSHHWINGHEFEQTPRDGEGQGSLVCCSLWGPKKSDMSERLNNNKSIYTHESKEKFLVPSYKKKT